MKKTLSISNIITLVVTIAINYLSNTGLITGKTVGEVSAQYESLFTPAGYAFAIWGLIYVMLAAFVIYQSIEAFKEKANDNFVLKVGWWFVISCIANSLWIITWIYEYTGVSVLIILLLLYSLLKIVVNANMERWDAPLKTIAFNWWPFCIYSGWVTVALIANISAYLVKIGWNGWGLGEPAWAIIMILAAGVINLFMIWSRNMREFAGVGIWALIAVAVANGGGHLAITWTALIVSAILLIVCAVQAYQNRATLPFRGL